MGMQIANYKPVYKPAERPETLYRILQDFHYKDGWKFDLKCMGTWHLFITVHAQNAFSTAPDPIMIGAGYSVPNLPTEEAAHLWLIAQILAIEAHEACEFYEHAGRKTFWPHGINGPTSVKIELPQFNRQAPAGRFPAREEETAVR